MTVNWSEFILGLFGNGLVGAVFVWLAWWKTDAIAARFEERRRLARWNPVATRVRGEIERTLLYCRINVAIQGRWIGGSFPPPEGFASLSPSAWAERLTSILSNSDPSDGGVSLDDMKSPFDVGIVFSMYFSVRVIRVTRLRLDRIIDRYAQTLPGNLEEALLATVAALETFESQVRDVKPLAPDSAKSLSLRYGLTVARDAFLELERLSQTLGGPLTQNLTPTWSRDPKTGVGTWES